MGVYELGLAWGVWGPSVRTAADHGSGMGIVQSVLGGGPSGLLSGRGWVRHGARG